MSKSAIAIASTIVYLIAPVSNAQETSRAYEHLKELEVFIGDWEGKMTVPEGARPSESRGEVAGRQVALSETVRWAPGKCGQVIDYKWHMEGQPPILAVSLLGWDQGRKQIVSNDYTTETGTWSGTWKKEDGKWTCTYQGLNLDGTKCSGKRVYAFSDEDHYVMRDVSRIEAGAKQPDLRFEYSRKPKAQR